jgi:hypothetical protein
MKGLLICLQTPASRGPEIALMNVMQNRMKKRMRLALMVGLLALAISSATAQSTDVVQHANFVLKGTVQTSSGETSVRLVTKDILAALNASGAYQFGPKAMLLFVSSDEQPPLVIVRDVIGGQTTNTDVSEFFGVAEIGDPVRSRNESTRWETWKFSFDNNATNEMAFQLWGATTIHRGAIRTRGVGTLAGSKRVQSDVKGVGRVQDAVTIFSGSVSGANASLVTESEQ